MSQLLQTINESIEEVSHGVFSQLPIEFQDEIGKFANFSMHALGRLYSGLELKNDWAGVDFCYLEGGSRENETIVFLHGFSDSKYSFSPAAKELSYTRSTGLW